MIHRELLPGFAVLAACTLAGCGDLPRPFAGYPGRNALMLSQPPPPRLVVAAPDGAMLPAKDAGTWTHDMADALVAEELPAYVAPPGPFDWTLRLTATLHGDHVLPHYQILDAKGADHGALDGAPVPASAWAQAAPDVLKRSAGEAAPQVLALLRSADATIKQNDPNSLYNRPARVWFSGVTGAPGDGNAALARNMRRHIPDTGDLLVPAQASADFWLRGTVRVTDEPDGQQQVEIHWLVSDRRGQEAGDVAQGHDIQKGTLDNHWGEIAAVITEEAAGGVHDVITNYTGRHKANRN